VTTDAPTPRTRPDPITAVPVRRPGRRLAIAALAVLATMFLHVLVTNDQFQWTFIVTTVMFAPPVLGGLRGTLVIMIAAMALGVGLSLGLAVMRLSSSPILRCVAFIYIWFFRAVPRLVLAVLFGNLGILWPRIELGLPFDHQLGALFGVDLRMRVWGIDSRELLTGLVAGVLALGLSEAAYMAEIVRAGVRSVDSGQAEAAHALGLTRRQSLRRIVLPQAMRAILPPTGNETIAMLKDTALVAYTPVTAELFFQLQAISARTFRVFPVLVTSCLWYLILSSLLMVGQHYLERHFSRGYGTRGKATAPVPPPVTDLTLERHVLAEDRR
jgi:polar amino acid transport system permease protein